MKKRLVIGPGVSCDLPRLIGTRLLVQASSGAGKSWLLRRLLEQSHGKVQQIVIDPEGEFASLRKKYDYVLAARQGGDTLADPRTAKLLAERLLEVGVSAILDIYELASHERVKFVRLFLEALVDAPKKLWHPVLVVLDESHVYCPETGEAESANAVKGLCSRGRKRGFCAVLATQRLSKLAKDAAAELNNKLIGRTSLDVDMARAGDELGFTKADRLRLRDLEDGEFFAFGPALSRVVKKVHVGGVATEHPKVGGLAAVGPPPPSKRIRALLPKLSDLPAEAEAREKSIADLRADLATVRRELTIAKQAVPKTEIKTVEKFVFREGHIKRIEKLAYQVLQASGELALVAKIITDTIGRVTRSETSQTPLRVSQEPGELEREMMRKRRFEANKERLNSQKSEIAPRSADTAALPPGELAILTAVVQTPGLDRQRLSVLVGYKKSSRDVYVQRLSKQGYVTVEGKQIHPTDAGRRALGDSYKPLPTGDALIEHWRQKLPVGELEIFDLLLRHGPGATVDRERIRDATGKKKSSTDVYIQRLAARGLVATAGRGVVRLAQLEG